MTDSRRGNIRKVSFLTALLAVLGAGTASGYYKAARYENMLESSYMKAVEDTSVYLDNIHADLVKGYYAGTPQQMSYLSAKLWREASAAKAALGSLPITALELGSTYRFLSQVGDYAMAVSKNALNGQPMTDDERNNLHSLMRHAAGISAQMNSLERGLSAGEITMETIQNTAAKVREGELPEDTSIGGFEELEQSFEGYPTLIYDGPFSDHILDREPLLIQGKAEISREQARRIAAEGLDISADRLTDLGDEVSRMPCYCFSTGEQTVAVTKNGGYICYVLGSYKQEEGAVSREAAMDYAEDYLEEMGYSSMEDTYYEVADGVLTVNFAHETDDDVRCYTDLIKVSVSMDNGRLISMDARGYIVNHKERQAVIPRLSEAQARAKLSGSLRVEESRLAWIPTAGLNEVSVYEFTCRAEDGQGVLVYINTQNGREEQIFLLVESENGVLTK